MKFKKVITLCLLLVLSLQLFPVRQAVRYFFVDNFMVEEIVDTPKNASKNVKLFDEDSMFLFDHHQFHPLFILNGGIAFFVDDEKLPNFHSSEIHTPPPNLKFI